MSDNLTPVDVQRLYDQLEKLSNQQSDSSNKTSDQIASLDKKLSLHMQKMDFELKKINELDNTQNGELTRHIAGVNTLKEMLRVQKEEVARRLEELEQPRKLLVLIKNISLSLSAIVAASLALFKVWELIFRG